MSLEALKILARCHMFGRVSEAGMQELAAMAQVQKLSRGQIVFHQGDEPPGMFVVGSGTVRIYKIAPNGKEHVLHLAGPGLTFAEVAVMGNFPCPAFAQAIEMLESMDESSRTSARGAVVVMNPPVPQGIARQPGSPPRRAVSARRGCTRSA